METIILFYISILVGLEGLGWLGFFFVCLFSCMGFGIFFFACVFFKHIFTGLQDHLVCMMVEKKLLTFQMKTKEYSHGKAVV